jgi:hypothetical protein
MTGIAPLRLGAALEFGSLISELRGGFTFPSEHPRLDLLEDKVALSVVVDKAPLTSLGLFLIFVMPRSSLPFGLRPPACFAWRRQATNSRLSRAAAHRSQLRSPRATRERPMRAPFLPPPACACPRSVPATSPGRQVMTHRRTAPRPNPSLICNRSTSRLAVARPVAASASYIAVPVDLVGDRA